jgi:hypothetical protein
MNSMRVPATLIFAAVMIIILVSSSRTTYTFGPASTPVAACATPPMAEREPEAHRACPWPRRTRHSFTRDDLAKDSWMQDAAADFAGPEQSRPEFSQADASPPPTELPPE